MQTYIVQWTFPDQKSHFEGADAFVQYVEGGCPNDRFEGFEVVNRVLSPQNGTGWAIVKASNHKAIWKWCEPWCRGFSVDIDVVPVLSDAEYISAHKEIGAD